MPALCTLSFEDANKVPICRNGGLDTIVRHIRDGAADIARLACCTVANLAEMAVNVDLIHDSGKTIRLTELLVLLLNYCMATEVNL